ncbi:MAG TPA: ferric reductase-like transmembrane domain-containing protein [Oligoflexus sp.]|uniref:sulfite oxidase heme-binding subunit YedZ n=1 Tax=Oligoflexus sp. TaxID=1971216 RepID=UPI002D59F47E|nr:ferric reductase-like transmembrane domain-containing protein [Oligoflexus sp.]HYX36950.1 ferric reductase-like transmembrane domain-containing protein [Oligoflexus sp.]
MRYFGWSLGLLPILWLGYVFTVEGSGPNPVTEVLHLTGLWGLCFLLGSLAVRPLVQIGKLRALQPWKKILGLLGFFYGAIHSLIYMALDQGWDWAELIDDFTKRVHIRFGMIALILLLPLALTSNLGSQKALGRKWKTLHRLVFPVGVLIGLHYMLARKTGFDRASWALAIVVLLILLRWKPLILRLQKFLPTPSYKKS